MKIFFMVTLMFLSGYCLSNESPRSISQSFFSSLPNENGKTRFGLNTKNELFLFSSKINTLAALAECEAQVSVAQYPVDFVDAGLIFDRWDTPTSCSVGEVKQSERKSEVEINCVWGENTEHIAGTKLQLFVVFSLENKLWKIYDVKHGFQGDSQQTKTTFLERLEMATHQSKNPDLCRKNKKYPNQ